MSDTHEAAGQPDAATTNAVPADLVDAAIHAADALGRDVAQVPVIEIARRAGISRSTLLRRLGGTRAPLDAAVRAAGIDPGEQRPARERAIDAGAQLISERGLAAVTLEAVATTAHCSVYTLYLAFGGRSGLFHAIFDHYRPVLDLRTTADPDTDLRAAVTEIYGRMAQVWTREPRIVPAIIAEILARPHDPTVSDLVGHILPLTPLFGVIDWLDARIHTGALRDLPRLLLLQQMISPLLFHVLMRPTSVGRTGLESPDLDETCAILADNFVRAVGGN